jgi:membrane protein implicated in regulation of membrane protease activity
LITSDVGREGAVARDSSVVGQVGTLVHATRGSAGPGEVRIRIRGGSEIYLAWSEQPLPAGTTVLVVESRGARNVDVVPWAKPLGD